VALDVRRNQLKVELPFTSVDPQAHHLVGHPKDGEPVRENVADNLTDPVDDHRGEYVESAEPTVRPDGPAAEEPGSGPDRTSSLGYFGPGSRPWQASCSDHAEPRRRPVEAARAVGVPRPGRPAPSDPDLSGSRAPTSNVRSISLVVHCRPRRSEKFENQRGVARRVTRMQSCCAGRTPSPWCRSTTRTSSPPMRNPVPGPNG